MQEGLPATNTQQLRAESPATLPLHPFPPTRRSPSPGMAMPYDPPLGAADFLSMPALQSNSQLEMLSTLSPASGEFQPTDVQRSGSGEQTNRLPKPRSFRRLQARHSGSVKRNADLRAQTFLMPSASISSPLVEGLGKTPPLHGTASDTNEDSSNPMSPGIRSVMDAINAIKSEESKAPSSNRASSCPPAHLQRKTLFCLFGSLDRKVSFHEMSDIFQKHHHILEPFYLAVLLIDNVFPPDFNILAQLKNPSLAPAEEFFAFPMVSWPLTTIFLIGCFLVTARRVGYAELLSSLQDGGILTLGKGVFAALAVAESKNEEELIRNASRHYRAAFCVGIAYQKKQMEVEHLSVGCPHNGFSILIVNIPVSTLQLLIDQTNTHAGLCCASVDSAAARAGNSDAMGPLSEIQISRVISPRSAVVVGHPLDLMRLDMLLVKFADATGIKIHKDFLPTPVPENSPFFNQGLQYEVCRNWSDMDFSLEATDLIVPIFSPQNGGELKMCNNLAMEIAGAVTCVPQDLTYSLQNLRDGDILLDFSPASMRVGQMIAWTRRSIVCIAEPSDRVEESILPSPRRSARNDLICGTLGKCAIIQELLSKFGWEGKPSMCRVTQLSTSFIFDLKLLIDLDHYAMSVVGDIRSPEMSITSFPQQQSAGCGGNGGAAGSIRDQQRSTSGFIGSPRAMSLVAQRNRLSNTSLNHFAGLVGANTTLGGAEKTPASTHSVSSTRFVVIRNANRQAINLYEVAPLIKYLEMQHRCVLTQGAVEFSERLSKATALDFPPHTLLLCPTVLQLLEFWDGLEFLQKLKQQVSDRKRDMQVNYDAPPGVQGAAIRRRRQLKRATDVLYRSTTGTTTPVVSPGGSMFPRSSSSN